MGKQGSVNFGYDSVTPEVREWYYDLFDYLLGKLDSNIYWMVRQANCFGCYYITDEDLKMLFNDFLPSYLSRHPEATAEDVLQRVGYIP